ncbi:MAG: YfhO family protein [Gemmatimonadetes bacterium]|nr:YfhO family protein [Gemmatimonadota bacterium]
MLFREFVLSNGMLFGSDTMSLGYPARWFYAQAVRELGSFPLWNPFILGGTPFIESTIGGDTFYPTTLLAFVQDLHRALGWKLVLHVYVAGLVTYGWIRALGLSRGAAFVSGLAYLLAPFMVTLVYPGHDGKLFVTALAPLLFWVAEWSLKGRGWLPYATVGLVVTLVLLTPHYQAAYFLFGAVGAYYIFRTLQIGLVDKARRLAAGKLAAFLLAATLGATAAGIQVIPPLWYVANYSRRTATTTATDAASNLEYASSWSLHPEEIAGLVVPEFVGSSVETTGWTSSTYWGRNAFKLNHEYAGLVILLLVPIGLLSSRRRGLQWFFAGLGATALLYGLGRHTPVWRAFYELLPGIKLFRAPSMTVFVFGLAAVSGAAFGVEHLLQTSSGATGEGEGKGSGAQRSIGRVLWGTVAVLAVLALLASTGALTSLWLAVVYRDIGAPQADALVRARSYLVMGFWVATSLLALTAAVWEGLRRRWFGSRTAVAFLAIIVAIDLFRVDAAFLRVVDPQAYFAPDEALRFLMAERERQPPFRVLSLAQSGQDVLPALHGLELAAGHHPNDLARYRELIGMVGSGLPEHLLRSEKILSVTNVRYLLTPVELAPQMGREPVARGGRYAAFELAGGQPRAYLVADAVVLPDSQAVPFMMSSAFDPASQVVLAEPAPLALEGGAVSGNVTWTAREVNRLALRVETDRPSLLVLAENWFPAWRATVDGESVPVLRANHTFRAVPLSPGTHTVELTYRSRLLARALATSVAGLLVLVASGAASWARARRAGAGASSGSRDA